LVAYQGEGSGSDSTPCVIIPYGPDGGGGGGLIV